MRAFSLNSPTIRLECARICPRFPTVSRRFPKSDRLLASHLLVDAGWGAPKTYGESFTALAEHKVVDVELATRLRAAAGLRNLLAHQYGAIDIRRLYEFADARTSDLTAYCSAVAAWCQAQNSGTDYR